MRKILFNSIIVSNNKNILILKKENTWLFPNKVLHSNEVPINIICKETEKIIGINLTSKDCISMINIKEPKNKDDSHLEHFYLFNINEDEVILLNQNSGFSDGKWVSFKEVYRYIKHNEDIKSYIKKIENIIF